MKNLLKSGLLVFASALVLVSCDPPHTTGSAKPGIDSPQTKIDTTNKTAIDTIKKDTVKK